MTTTTIDSSGYSELWRTEPAPETAEETPDAVQLAVTLLARIGEDPMLRPSYRIAARRYFRELRKAGARAAGDALVADV